jgi:hypothetical protein
MGLDASMTIRRPSGQLSATSTGHGGNVTFNPPQSTKLLQNNPPIKRHVRYIFDIVVPGLEGQENPRRTVRLDPDGFGVWGTMTIGPYDTDYNDVANRTVATLQSITTYTRVQHAEVTVIGSRITENGQFAHCVFAPDNIIDVTNGDQISAAATSATVRAGDSVVVCAEVLDYAIWIASARERSGDKLSIYQNKRAISSILSTGSVEVSNENDWFTIGFHLSNCSSNDFTATLLKVGDRLGRILVDACLEFTVDNLLGGVVSTPPRLPGSSDERILSDWRGAYGARPIGLQSGYYADHLPQGLRIGSANGALFATSSSDLRQLLSNRVAESGEFPPITFGEFGADLGISAKSLGSALSKVKVPNHVKAWLIDPHDSSGTTVSDPNSFFCSPLPGLEIDGVKVTDDAILCLFGDPWEGPLVFSGYQRKSVFGINEYIVPGDRRSAIIRYGGTVILPAPADGEDDAFPAFGVDAGTGSLTEADEDGAPPLTSRVFYHLVAGNESKQSDSGFFDTIKAAAGTVLSIASPIVKSFIGSSPAGKNGGRLSRTLFREKDLPAGQSLIVPNAISQPAFDYYGSNFATFSRDQTWIFGNSYSSNSAHKASDRVLTISFAGTAMYRAIYAESAEWRLLLGGAKLPCKEKPKTTYGQIPTLTNGIKVRLLVDVSFAHGLANDPAVTSGSFHLLTPLDTPGVRAFETSVDCPLVHIDNSPLADLSPGGTATDFAAISVLLPVGLSFTSPLPEGRYVSGKYVKYDYAKGADLALYANLNIRAELTKSIQFNSILAESHPGNDFYIKPSGFVLHQSVPDEILLPGAEISYATLDSPLIRTGGAGDVRVNASVRRSVISGGKGVSTKGDLRGGILLVGVDFEVGDSVGKQCPTVALA